MDLDILILEKEGISHDKILEQQGREALLDLENKHTLTLDLSKLIFSPGGSIVYSTEAMKKLSKETIIIFLDVPLDEIRLRIGNNSDYQRGIVDFKEKGLDGLFAERVPMLKSYAHYVIKSAEKPMENVVREIIEMANT